MNGLSIIILILGLVLCFLGYFGITRRIKEDEETKKENEKIQKENYELKNSYSLLLAEKSNLENQKEEKTKELNDLQNLINNFQETSRQAYEEYAETLEDSYEAREEEYRKYIEQLRDVYDAKQDQFIRETTQIEQQLEDKKKMYAAVVEAQVKEKEIEEQLDFYCLQPMEEELDDVQMLERIKPKLHQPRILSMLIWSTYFQKPMTALCNNVLGTTTVTGIYKITNIETKQCYIGQAADVATRWKNHAKCGLGIDTPANNKLYKAMKEYGLQSFSWELLEKCTRAQLDEKERFYIELYQAKEYGYNSTGGNR